MKRLVLVLVLLTACLGFAEPEDRTDPKYLLSTQISLAEHVIPN
ncbi:MAG: hypothetical protein AAF267_21960 [Deinococcota bacterium]